MTRSQPDPTAKPKAMGNDPVMSGSATKSEQVRATQAALKSKGYDPGTVDGIPGPKTTAGLHELPEGGEPAGVRSRRRSDLVQAWLAVNAKSRAPSVAGTRPNRREKAMKARSMLGGLLTSLLLLGGCYMPPSTTQGPPPPPAAPLETVPAQPSPSYVWVPGSNTWQPATRTYVWAPGHWTVPPQGYAWVPGHWETQANGSVWVDEQWRHN